MHVKSFFLMTVAGSLLSLFKLHDIAELYLPDDRHADWDAPVVEPPATSSKGFEDDFGIDNIREDSIPNPPLPDGNNTFSACLLVMDDNHRLVEWLAYHYYVLPLRYLIVAVDPRSRTSPTSVLNRWRRMGIYILEWGDDEIFKNDTQQKKKRVITARQKTRQHRARQPRFYDACVKQARTDQRSWVALHDTDEFLVYSQKGGEYYEEWEKRARREHEDGKSSGMIRLKPKHVPPTTAEEGALIKYMRQEAAAGQKYFNQKCFAVARLLFGGLQDDPEHMQVQLEKEDKSLLQGVINPKRLDTIRYNRHAARDDYTVNGVGKSILDVSRLDVHKHNVTDVHHPIKEQCQNPRSMFGYWKSLLTVHHYLGSWEAFSFRDDSRRGEIRNYTQWQSKVDGILNVTDNTISPWIGGFVRSVGPAKARELLQGAGLPPGFKNPLTSEWGNRAR